MEIECVKKKRKSCGLLGLHQIYMFRSSEFAQLFVLKLCTNFPPENGRRNKTGYVSSTESFLVCVLKIFHANLLGQFGHTGDTTSLWTDSPDMSRGYFPYTLHVKVTPRPFRNSQQCTFITAPVYIPSIASDFPILAKPATP